LRGNGEDVDFFYFAGPSDFAKSFKLPAVGALEALDDYFDARVKDDTNFNKAVDSGTVTKAGFRKLLRATCRGIVQPWLSR
jgi:hypothetical protein